MQKKLLTLLVLLAVATTGAWAQEPDPINLTSTNGTEWTLTEMPAYDVELEVTYYTDAELAAKEALQTAIAIATNINPEGLADAITAAQAALNDENATAESMAQAVSGVWGMWR